MASSNNNYYRNLIVKHFNNPENYGLINSEDSICYQFNSGFCVDNFQIELTISNKIVLSAKFIGVGCAISTASIDIFCNIINNKSLNEVLEINKNYEAMLKNSNFNKLLLLDLTAFQNVLRQKSRLKCALIISEAISKIINNYNEKTENELK